MKVVKNGKIITPNNIKIYKDSSIKTISNIYTVIKGKIVLIWSAIKDILSAFGAGFWKNEGPWNNNDSWKN